MVDTKQRILDTAERLFAERGFASTSLRDITAEAGVNLASVHYHFGSKLALFSAVFGRRLEPVNRERLARLEALTASVGDGAPAIEDVLLAFFGPAFERLREQDSGWARFLQLVGRTHSDLDAEIRGAFLCQFEHVVERFLAALRCALPELSPELLGHRCHFLVGAMAHTLVFFQKTDAPMLAGASEPDALLENLVAFCAGGLRAPASASATTGRAP